MGDFSFSWVKVQDYSIMNVYQVGMCESQIDQYSSNGYNCDLRN